MKFKKYYVIEKSKIYSLELRQHDSIICQQTLFIASFLGTFIINEKYLNRLVIKEQRKSYRKNSICIIVFPKYINLEGYFFDLFQANFHYQ